MASETSAPRSTPWLAVAIAVAAGCGSGHNGQSDDAPGGGDDGGGSDGSGGDAGMPAPPVLGAQLSRMGRAAVSTVLIAPFTADGAAKTAVKDAYNQAGSVVAWQSTLLQTGVTIESEMEANMAMFDALDVLTSAVPQPPQRGCDNAFRYAGPAGPNSYKTAADLFADDQLYVDTAIQTCEVYLALEIDFASGGNAAHVTCGGRMPSHDALDVTYSVLAAGVGGLDPAQGAFTPLFHGNLVPHSDVNESVFPFLGAPH